MTNQRLAIVCLVVVASLLLGACSVSQGQSSDPLVTPSATAQPVEAVPSATPTDTPAPTMIPTLPETATPTNTPLPTDTPTPTATALSVVPAPLVAIDSGHGGVDLGARHFTAE